MENLKPTSVKELLKAAVTPYEGENIEEGQMLASPVPEPDATTLEILGQYPHVFREKTKFPDGTEAFVFWLPHERKFAVRIKCVDTQDTDRVVRSSDLHQVKRSTAATIIQRRKRRRLARSRSRGRARGPVQPEQNDTDSQQDQHPVS